MCCKPKLKQKPIFRSQQKIFVSEMDPATIAQTKPMENDFSNNVIDSSDNEIYDDDMEEEEDSLTFKNKTKKLIRPEKSASSNSNHLFSVILTFSSIIWHLAL